MKRWVAGLAVSTMLAISSPTSAVVILDQSNNANVYSIDTGFNASQIWRAQTFTVGVSGQLARIEVDLYLRSSASGLIQLDLLSTSAGAPTSTALGSASVPNSSVPYVLPDPPLGHAFVMFDLTASNINVSQGDVLAIALKSSDNQLIGGWVGGQTNYADGAFYLNQPTNDLGWVPNLPVDEDDLYFKTYVDDGAPPPCTINCNNPPSSVPEPATLALLALGLAGLGFNRRRLGPRVEVPQ